MNKRPILTKIDSVETIVQNDLKEDSYENSFSKLRIYNGLMALHDVSVLILGTKIGEKNMLKSNNMIHVYQKFKTVGQLVKKALPGDRDYRQEWFGDALVVANLFTYFLLWKNTHEAIKYFSFMNRLIDQLDGDRLKAKELIEYGEKLSKFPLIRIHEGLISLHDLTRRVLGISVDKNRGSLQYNYINTNLKGLIVKKMFPQDRTPTYAGDAVTVAQLFTTYYFKKYKDKAKQFLPELNKLFDCLIGDKTEAWNLIKNVVENPLIKEPNIIRNHSKENSKESCDLQDQLNLLEKKRKKSNTDYKMNKRIKSETLEEELYQLKKQYNDEMAISKEQLQSEEMDDYTEDTEEGSEDFSYKEINTNDDPLFTCEEFNGEN